MTPSQWSSAVEDSATRGLFPSRQWVCNGLYIHPAGVAVRRPAAGGAAVDDRHLHVAAHEAEGHAKPRDPAADDDRGARHGRSVHARSVSGAVLCDGPATTKAPLFARLSEYRHGDSNPGFRRERAAS